MDRAQLKHGFFFRVTPEGKIPSLSEFVKAVERWAFSNPNRDGFLGGPKRVYPTRSHQQLKSVMGLWMDTILEELGYFPNDKGRVYGDLKIEMGWYEERVSPKTGLVTKVPKETRTLDTAAYSKWMDDFRDFIQHNHGIILPTPDSTSARI